MSAKQSNPRSGCLILLLLLIPSLPCLGEELRVARIFSDHGVLQQGVPVPVWGWPNPAPR
jgi:hypothetical protein